MPASKNSTDKEAAPTREAKPKKQSLQSALNMQGPAGFVALLQDTGIPGQPLPGARDLPLRLIDQNPYQSRQVFNEQALNELAQSVSEHGVIEPIVVRPKGERYEIVAGERRYRASLLAGKETVPARIMDLSDRDASLVTAIENLQREDLDIEDEARQFDYLCRVLEVSQRELARMLGKNPVYISRRIRLLKRPDLMDEYRAGRLTLHQAAALAEPGLYEAVDSRGISSSAGESGDSVGINGEGDLDDVVLIEREDMPGYIVSKLGEPFAQIDSAGISPLDRTRTRPSGGPMFRFRPIQQFHNWVARVRPQDIPLDDRERVRLQLSSIKQAVEQQLKEFEKLGETPTEGTTGDTHQE